ncbi:hypothetical protein KIPE111705_05820 [Kibdelosporangium persicum]|uniref:Fibronectin type-III domain-containing protein n=1 Tax=Kibdelosporangium persicum TaxID=2698649 RepID=A0ABX2FEJ7_9PSEU|nr:hypothetical protein [Kibdelosporangium persicum]NRN69241.1 Fibronectin type-III domain-containing protein [Kibdelosporangium persicum]
MTRRARISVWVLGAALLLGTIILLRNETGPSEPVGFPGFAVDAVDPPRPAQSVPPPGPVRMSPGPGRLRLAWADGVAGGQPLDGVTGYEVRWDNQVRLVAQPVVQLDGLAEREHHVEVRSVDPFGRRSEPVRVTGMPSRAAPLPLGHVDEFDSADSVHSEVPGSKWHVSGYKGCIDLASEHSKLIVQFGCGADDVVLRSRAAFRLAGGNGRLTVVTDAAGPRGGLNLDFVPGPADRVGSRGNPSPALPPGTIRVSISDGGARLFTGPGMGRGTFMPISAPAATRGSGVLHRFDVVFTPAGTQVFQDDSLVVSSDVVPPWATSTVLVGMIGPPGRLSRAHVDAVGMSAVVPPAEQVVEFGAVFGTQRVLRPQENAPSIGVSRQPMLGASAVRVRTTVTLGAGADPHGMSLQVGDRTVPMVPATPGPPAEPGSNVTLVAQLPPDLLAGDTASLSPLVIRGQGTGAVLESYLEIVGTAPSARLPDPRLANRVPALPTVNVRLRDVNGIDLGKTASANAPFQLEIVLDPKLAQRDADEVAAVRGIEVFLNERRIAAVPTDLQGPAVGGTYRLTVRAADELPGDQTVEVRLHPADQSRQPQSTSVGIALIN